MKKTLILSVCLLSAGLLSAQENAIILPDGTKLVNPYILDRTPSTITIGHDQGGLQVPIKDLPEEYQKILKFNPEKAANFDKAKAKRKAAREAEQKAKTAKENKARAKASREIEIRNLKKRIRELKLQIESDEKRLSKLEQVFDADRSSANNLAAVQTTSSFGNCSASWGRWGIRRFRARSGRNRAAVRAVRERNRQIRRLNEEADTVAREYTNLDRRLQEAKLELGAKEERLEWLQENATEKD